MSERGTGEAIEVGSFPLTASGLAALVVYAQFVCLHHSPCSPNLYLKTFPRN